MSSEDSAERADGRDGRLLTVVFTLAFGTIATGAAGAVVYLLLSDLLTSGSRTAADFGRLEKAALQILIFSVAVGVIAMAVLEVIKRLTPVRALYHSAALSRRLGPGSAEFLTTTVSRHRSPVVALDLPIEQLTAQFQTALDQIVAGVAALQITWSPADEAGTVRGSPSATVQDRLSLLNAVIGRDFFAFGSAPTPAEPSSPGEPSSPPAPPPGRTEAASRENELRRSMEIALRSSLDAGLDSLQVSIGSGWKRLVRLSAALVSAVSAIAVSVLYGVGSTVLLTAVLGGFVLGGFFAWLARDLVAGVERWRR